MTRRQRIQLLLPALQKEYPDARCLLDYDDDPFRLLIATILSAQTTDEGVNRVTPILWQHYPDAESLAAAELSELEAIVHPLGFFRSKSRSIRSAASYLLENHDGSVPATMNQLVLVPGTGRKTANVVLGEIFGKPAIIVDTHVRRLSGRLDLSRKKDPDRVEADLIRLIPASRRTAFSHQLGAHGRRVCHSRKPSCQSCAVLPICPRRGVAC